MMMKRLLWVMVGSCLAVLLQLPPGGVLRPVSAAESFFAHRVAPAYPPAAFDEGMEGSVTVLVRVDKTGHVRGAQIGRSSGHSVLDDSALRAAVESTYVPAKAEMTYSVHYSFNAGASEHRAGSMIVR